MENEIINVTVDHLGKVFGHVGAPSNKFLVTLKFTFIIHMQTWKVT